MGVCTLIFVRLFRKCVPVMFNPGNAMYAWRFSCMLVFFLFFCFQTPFTQESKHSDASLHQRFNQHLQGVILESEKFLSKDINRALTLALDAIELSDRYPTDAYFFETRNHAAKVCFFAALYPQAFNYWNDCLKHAEQKGDAHLIGKFCFNLSALCIAIHEFDYAIRYLKSAEKYFYISGSAGAPSAVERIHIYNNLGIIHASQGHAREAELNFQKALVLIDAENLVEQRITLYQAYSTFLIEQNQLEKAENLLREVLLFNQSFQNQQTEATARIKLARIYEKRGYFNRAYEELLRGYDISVSLNASTLMKEYAEDLRRHEKRRGHFSAALRYGEIRDSLLAAEQIAEVKKAILTRELERVQKVHEAQLQRMGRTHALSRVSLVSLLVIALIALSGFFIFYRLKSKSIRHRLKANEQVVSALEKTLEQLEDEVKVKEKELLTVTLNEMRRKEALKTFLGSPAISLKQMKEPDVNSNSLLLRGIDRIYSESVNGEFEKRFREVDEDFYTNLISRFPALTANERKLCAFLKLDLTTKEIVQMTGQNVRAVEMARTRLRKKLGISHSDIDLHSFIKSL